MIGELKPEKILVLWRVLVFVPPGIFCPSFCTFKDELADAGAWLELEWDGGHVVHLEDGSVGDAGLDEAGGDVDGESEPGKPAPAFDPSADVGWEVDFLDGDAVDCFSGLEDERVVDLDDFGDVVRIGVFCDGKGVIGVAVDAELVAQRKVNGGRPDLLPVKRMYLKPAVVQFFNNPVPCEYAHVYLICAGCLMKV